MIPNKALGQHFFTNTKVLNRIIEIINPSPKDTYIEIGPGKGAFTFPLSKRVMKLIAIEKDSNLVSYLNKVATEGYYNNIRFENQDILDVALSNFISEPYYIFGSLPYNKSKEIIEMFLLQKHPRPRALYFIVQKEVSQKYLRQTSSLSYFSAFAQLTSVPCKLFEINPGSFTPPPQVKSVLIEFKLKRDITKFENCTQLLSIIFKQPRKTIRNNLLSNSSISQDFLSLISNKVLSRRASELKIKEVEDLLLLYNKSR
ncbi:MAG: 16S rRNA (adenine(1518)-N(6)/adenine(1519)-N(6))-dimethyltransferase RsmA [bacterium]